MTIPDLEPYRLAADTLGQDEIEAAKEVLDSKYLTMGVRVRRFEEEFAGWIGARNAVMVNSGSSANLLIIEALRRSLPLGERLEAGDEVLVPGLSWPTTAWPVVQLGLVPVFVDVDPSSLGVDLSSAELGLSARTKALFLIHPLGRALDLDAYRAFCERHQLLLLEDCCESLGAHWREEHVGTVGLANSFSFYFSHHISTIEGGMVVTQDDGVADDLRSLRAHGWVRDRADRQKWTERYPEFDARFLFATTGFNVRPTEIAAAIGSVQLRRLDEMLFAREVLARAVAGWIRESAPWLELIGAETLEGTTPVERRRRVNSWMTLPLRVRRDTGMGRPAVVRHLEQMGVETRPIIAGNLARHPATSTVPHRLAGPLPVCDALLADSFMIGCHPVLSTGSLIALERAITSLSSLG